MDRGMTLEEFRENENFAPVEAYTFASRILEITDCPELVEAAEAFTRAEDNFYAVIAKYGLEMDY